MELELRERPHRSKSARDLASRYGIWIVLLVVLTVYLLSLTPHIGPYDSAQYLILAKSIATGQGYRDLQQVGIPPHTLAPFGFPLLLSPVWLLFPAFPDNAYAFKLIPVLFGMATWALFYLFLRRRSDLSAPLILAIVLLSALTPLMIFFASQELMTETSYMFFSFLAILLFERVASREKPGKLAFAVAVVAVVLSYFVRTVGLALLIAVVLYFALRRDWRRAALILVLFTLLISPWVVRNLSVGTSPLSGDYGQDMLLKDYARPELGTIGSYWELVPRAFRNGYAHATDSLLWIFLPQLALERPVSLPAFLYQGWVKALLGLAITALVAWGMMAECWRKREITLPVLYTIVYLGPVLLQPWVGARNLIPIMPFLFYYFVIGLWALVNRGRVVFRGSTLQAANLAAWAAVLVILVSLARSDRLKIRTGLAYYAGNYADPSEQSFGLACQWIKANTAEQTLFFSPIPNWLYLSTGRRIASASGDTTAEFLDNLFARKVDYVVLQPERPSYDSNTVDFGENPLFEQTALAFPQSFTLRYKTDIWPETLVYELLEPQTP